MTDSTPPEELLSSLFHTSRALRRRRVIEALADQSTYRVSTRELARELASIEMGVPPERATGEPYRNVYNALSQTHLPTLADAGVIIYDPERQHVIRGPNYPHAHLLIAVTAASITAMTLRIPGATPEAQSPTQSPIE